MRALWPVLVVVATAAADQLPDFNKLWNYGDPAATRAMFLAILEKHTDAPSAYRLELRTQVARTHSLAGAFDEAHAILDDVARRLTPDVGPKRDLIFVRYLLERGRTHRSNKKRDKAIPLFEKAYAVAVEHKLDYYAIDAAHMMGITASPDQVMAWHEKALAIVDKTEDTRAQGWRATLYNNIGWEYHDRKQYEKALELHEKCLAVWKKRSPNSNRCRIAEWSVAKQLRMLGKLDDALARQRDLLPRYEKAKQPAGFVHEEIGECLLAQSKAAEARPHFRKAYEILKTIRWVKKERVARLKKLAETP